MSATAIRLQRVISGGQTGVDRAALDTALALGLDCGGWLPRGRLAEDGPLPPHYPLRETRSTGYAERTRRNVLEADGTLVLCRGVPSGGTALTITCARRAARPWLVVDLAQTSEADGLARVCDWLADARIAILNIAGPRESTTPGIYSEAARFLRALLASAG